MIEFLKNGTQILLILLGGLSCKHAKSPHLGVRETVLVQTLWYVKQDRRHRLPYISFRADVPLDTFYFIWLRSYLFCFRKDEPPTDSGQSTLRE